MLQATLGGLNYPGGRLYQELRDRQLVYEVSAELQSGFDTGMLHLYAASDPDRADELLAVIDRVVTDLQSTPVLDDELRRVRQMCLADFHIHLQTHEDRVFRFALDYLYDIDADEIEQYPNRIRAITAPDIQRAAQTYLDRSKRVVSLVTPLKHPRDRR